VPDGLAVADHLGIDRFLAVGVSTGGAYSLALAAGSPARVRGVLLCCAMSDMRHQPSRDTMSPTHCHAVWDASGRGAAVHAARDAFGDDGSRMFDAGDATLCDADRAFVAGISMDDPTQVAAMGAQFANGVQGYVDDRLADGPGWVSFDVGDVRCPVVIVHGADDTIVGPINAEHTASLLPQATVRMEPGHGHLSVTTTIVEPLLELAAATA
jgi:pimeloyl-ACP methyl ester carboxylesterase